VYVLVSFKYDIAILLYAFPRDEGNVDRVVVRVSAVTVPFRMRKALIVI
jgi:hypothetical protein